MTARPPPSPTTRQARPRHALGGIGEGRERGLRRPDDGREDEPPEALQQREACANRNAGGGGGRLWVLSLHQSTEGFVMTKPTSGRVLSRILGWFSSNICVRGSLRHGFELQWFEFTV